MASSTPPLIVTCSENIALLHLLHSVPDPPSRNPIEHPPVSQKVYTLPLQQERSLTGTLAFLSGLKDGPNHIPAVCVEESPKSAFLNVLVAVNKARPDDGKEILQTLRSGFERISALLSLVSDDGTPAVEGQVFTEIISMCSVRILCRLRFTSNRMKTPRQPIKELLQEAIRSIRGLEKETAQDSRLLINSLLFMERAREVIKLVDAWVKHRTPTRLTELVEGVHHLWRIGELRALLSIIPNRTMNPTSRKNLLNIIGKVARYREAARFLYRTARKTPLVQQMKIVLVSLPQDVFEKIPVNQCTPTLPSTFSRISELHEQRWDVHHVCRLLNVSEVEASNRFVQQTKKTLKEAKIHAEIQLLFYCELKASKLPPRVVCSTKDACFLCNLFIRMHGKIHTPRCHGKLYPGWRLPSSPRLKESEQKFNRELAGCIRKSLTTLFSRQQKTFYADPNESTLLTLPMSASTLSSLFSESTSSTSSITRASDVLIQPPSEIASKTLPSARSSSRGLSSESISVDSYKLLQGQILSQCVENNYTSPLYTAGNLEVQIEYSIGPDQVTPNIRPKNLSYSIEWLPGDEAERVREQYASSILNAESLEGEISHYVGDLNYFYITALGSVLKILF
ncbi:hypothetical protein BGZ60DRAFT_546315 [Tricladium varicosporioides]|nr:hypothetical protein BGZ60DRAFT_546315 [Hymenoscyphus varicosporioides]